MPNYSGHYTAKGRYVGGRYEGVRPEKSQRGLSRVTRWELDSGTYTDIAGALHKRRRKVVNVATERQAHEHRKTWLAEIIRSPSKQKPGLTVDPRQSGGGELGDFFEERFLPKVLREQAPTTYKHKSQQIRQHFLPLVGNVSLAEAMKPSSVEIVRDHVMALKKKNGKAFKANSKNSALMIYSSLLAHISLFAGVPKPRVSVIRDRVNYNKEKIRVGALRSKRLSDEEYQALFDLAQVSGDPDFYTGLLGLGGFIGCRKGEIGAVTWEDVDFEANQIFIHSHVSQEGNQHVPWVKNGVEGYVPIEPSFREVLLRLRERGTRYVLKGDVEGHLSSGGIYYHYNKIASQHFGKKTPVHALRHTFCSRLADNGVRVEIIKDLARHKDILTSYGYIEPSSDAREAAARALSMPPRKEQ